MKTIPNAIVSTDPSIRYTTAFVIDRSSGPMCTSAPTRAARTPGGRVEVAARERLAGKRERQERNGEEHASHSGGFPKYETSYSHELDRVGERDVTAAARPTHGSESATTKMTPMTTIARVIIPTAATPDAARVPAERMRTSR